MNSTYGIKKPANITFNDCDIYYNYRESRNKDAEPYKKINENILYASTVNDDTTGSSVLPGVYDLRLPLNIFGKSGFYTLYIKPKEIYGTIYDVSTLVGFNNIRGVVLNASQFTSSDDMDTLFSNGNLVGYRLEFLDDNGQRTGEYRIITSNNRCKVVRQTASASPQYTFSDMSSLVFCTVTPSVANSFNTTSLPFIGSNGTRVALVSTKFNPIMIELEMVEHDLETITTMLEGEQVRNLNTGMITTFNSKGEIYHQATYGNIVSADDTSINHDYKFNQNKTIIVGEKSNMETIKRNVGTTE